MLSKHYKLLGLMAVFIFVVCSFSVLAVSIVTVETVDNQIRPDETAYFNVNIENTANVKQRYSLYSLQTGQGWDVETEPIKDKIVELEPRKNYTVKVRVHPYEKLPPSVYAIQLSIESDAGEKFSEPLKVYLSPKFQVDYMPSIRVVVDMNEKINPNDVQSVKLFLENKNPLNLTGLDIKIKSDMPEFVKQLHVDLPPLEKKTVEFTVEMSKHQQPREYVLFFVFEKDGQPVKIVEKKVVVETIASPFTVDVTYMPKLLNQLGKVKVTNEGNVLNEQVVKVPLSFWGYLMARGKGERVKDDTGYYMTWKLSLAPGEVGEVEFLVHYRGYLYAIILVVLIWVFFAMVQAPVEVVKKAVITQLGEEGSLSEVKITLSIKNKLKKPLKSVSVVDSVPAIAHIEKGHEMGTLHPQEVKHTGKGTVVSWHVAELDGQEERLITYKVKAKFSVLGEFELPRASVEYKKKGMANRAYSNVVSLGEKK